MCTIQIRINISMYIICADVHTYVFILRFTITILTIIIMMVTITITITIIIMTMIFYNIYMHIHTCRKLQCRPTLLPAATGIQPGVRLQPPPPPPPPTPGRRTRRTSTHRRLVPKPRRRRATFDCCVALRLLCLLCLLRLLPAPLRPRQQREDHVVCRVRKEYPGRGPASPSRRYRVSVVPASRCATGPCRCHPSPPSPDHVPRLLATMYRAGAIRLLACTSFAAAPPDVPSLAPTPPPDFVGTPRRPRRPSASVPALGVSRDAGVTSLASAASRAVGRQFVRPRASRRLPSSWGSPRVSFVSGTAAFRRNRCLRRPL